jgi:hypothetical protein
MTQVVFPSSPSVRYKADPDSRALICLNPEAETFTADLVAEIVNESYTGCSVTLEASDHLEQGARIICQIGPLAPIRAQVIWCREGEKGRVEAGLQYID